MSTSDERGSNFDRNATDMLKGHFLNPIVSMKNLLLGSLGLEIHRRYLLSVANIIFYAYQFLSVFGRYVIVFPFQQDAESRINFVRSPDHFGKLIKRWGGGCS